MVKKTMPRTDSADTHPALFQVQSLPSLIMNAGDGAAKRFLEFFTASIRNKNTRFAYARAIGQFLSWCEEHGLDLFSIEPMVVAAYIEQHGRSPQTVKQHLAAIRQLFDYLVVGQIVPSNPAASVRGPKYVIKKGKTPILSAEETRKLLESIDASTIIGLRDRALISMMVYTFGRISAVLGMQVGDCFQSGKRHWIKLHEKGGKYHEVPLHHAAKEYLDAYVAAAGIGEAPRSPLFRTCPGKGTVLSKNRLHRTEALLMIKRRCLAAGLPATTRCHTFRATGITTYLTNGGSIENAQAIAAHESPRTTKLYDRRRDKIDLEEIERIVI